jgi:peptidoglycan/xylan/chitin deacetylase (PgdA/CDA1 family)
VSDVLVLCYHAVSSRWPASVAVMPEALEEQLSHVVAHGYRGAAFTDAVLAPPWPRTVAVTFDDAFRSVLTDARPILDRLGLPATVFVPTAFVESGGPLRWHELERWSQGPYDGDLQPLGWDELGDLADAGWEIGSHAVSHRRLTLMTAEEAAWELEESRDLIEQRLGISCRSVAYPYGDVDDGVAAAAREAGYEAGAGLGRWPGERRMLRSPRVGVYRRDTLRRFSIKASPTLRRAAAIRPLVQALGL